MSLADNHAINMQRARRRREERDYRWVFWVAYPFFLALTLISRLTPWRGRIAGPRPSVFREAWVAANSTLPFAFMN